ncbi:MAG: hypothetical protein ACP5VQ_10965 [Phycisphaerae bacterium]
MDKEKKQNTVHPDTLESLKNLDNVDSSLAPADEGSGSATGFVAMLAHDNNQPDIFSPLSSVLEADMKASRGNVPPPRPQPKPLSDSAKNQAADIPEARMVASETAAISMSENAVPPSHAAVARAPLSSRPPKSQHDWYRVVIPLMLAMGSLLVLVGIWAVASLAGVPNALIPHDHSSDRYHAAISLAWYMTFIALPIGVLLNSMAIFMLYHLHWRSQGTI